MCPLHFSKEDKVENYLFCSYGKVNHNREYGLEFSYGSLLMFFWCSLGEITSRLGLAVEIPHVPLFHSCDYVSGFFTGVFSLLACFCPTGLVQFTYHFPLSFCLMSHTLSPLKVKKKTQKKKKS